MPVTNYQQSFFDNLNHYFPNRTAMVQAISEELSLCRSTANRRISGATQLRVDELLQLAQRFGISLPDGRITGTSFNYSNNQWKIKSPADYIEQLSNRLQEVDAWPDKMLYYASNDLPIFYELGYPNLLAFKLYVFGITSWGFNHWRSKPFNFQLIDPAVLERGAAISHYAFRVPTRELWSSTILSTTVNQLEYVARTGRFSDPELPFIILDELTSIINHQEAMAKNQRKYAPMENPAHSKVPYNLYLNELLSINTTICVNSSAANLLFLSLLTPNFLVSNDPVLGQHVSDWFESVFSEATELGPGASMRRPWFFNRLRARIAGARKRIEELSKAPEILL